MATTTLNTRIALKYDTLTNWNASEFILKKGEVAMCSLANSETAEQSTPPAVLLKVGDGDHKFRELPWASGLAADVYGWAKAATKPSYTPGEVGADSAGSAASALASAKAYTDQKIGALPAQAEYTLETGGTDGSLVLKKDGVAVGDAAVVKGWATLLAKAQKGVDDAAAAAAAAQAAQSTADGKYSKPAGGIPKTDLAEAVQTSLGKADTALQNHQTVTLESGTNNGTVKITVNGTATDNVAVKGLKSAAYTESSAYATAAQGTKADNAMPKAGGAFTGAVTVQAPTAEMNPATKQYVDTAINAVKQFEYQVVTELPTAAQATMGKIYLKAHSHNPSDGQPDSYDEFITVQSGSTYKWERIGNTDINLSEYVPITRKINKKALSSDITLYPTDVGVTEAAFPGLNKTGTVTGVKINETTKNPSSGVVDLGTVLTDESKFATAAQGIKADNAMPKSGDTFTGPVSSKSYYKSENEDLRTSTTLSHIAVKVDNGRTNSHTAYMNGQINIKSASSSSEKTIKIPDKAGTIALTSDIHDGTLTIQKNGETVGTFTANQSSSVTANITVPTKASDVNAMPTSGGTFTGNISVPKTITFTDTTNPFIKMTTGGTDFYFQSTSGQFGLGPTWDKATHWDSNGNVTFPTVPKVGSSSLALKTDLSGKQDKLTAGSNISISGNTISATVPTVNNGKLTIQKNGTDVATFTANQSTNATANITVPVKVSELTNDSGFTTNNGTVTQVKINGATKSPNSAGLVDLGTGFAKTADLPIKSASLSGTTLYLTL